MGKRPRRRDEERGEVGDLRGRGNQVAEEGLAEWGVVAQVAMRRKPWIWEGGNHH